MPLENRDRVHGTPGRARHAHRAQGKQEAPPIRRGAGLGQLAEGEVVDQREAESSDPDLVDREGPVGDPDPRQRVRDPVAPEHRDLRESTVQRAVSGLRDAATDAATAAADMSEQGLEVASEYSGFNATIRWFAEMAKYRRVRRYAFLYGPAPLLDL